MFIDSHAHLADPAFDSDREDVIGRARASGARAIVCIGESIAAAERAAQLADAHRGFVFATAGVHPHDAAQFDEERDIAALRDLVGRGAVAIGECGLDYHYDHSPREVQQRAFSAQLALAHDVDRPVVVHTREAEADTSAMVAEAGQMGIRGVLHCFTGSHALAEVGLAAGWHISISGIATFKRWDDDALIRLIPSDRLLVESDAPYLAPVPHRGKRNEPAWVSFTVARVAAARGVEADTISELTTANATRLFGLPISPRNAL